MSENSNANANNNAMPKEVAMAKENLLSATSEKPAEKLTMNYVLGKLEEISMGQAYVTEAITELGKIKSGGPGDVGTQEQAKAISEVVKARETTNQRLIALYEKMYDDLKPERKINNERLAIIGTLIENLGEGLTPIETKETLTEVLATALQDLSKNI